MATADDIAKLKDRALAETAAAGSLAALEEVRVLHTGRRSELAQILASIGSLAPEARGVIGKAANIARREIEAALAERKATLETAELTAQLANDRTDVTLPGDPYPRGALHLLTQVRLEIEEIFLALGYEIAEGPEVETEHYNFTALNTPDGHPARSASDTFYVDETRGTILRTQTSSVQVRVMEARTPPLYVISPGAVYRRDDVDATHSPMFHQLEGLAVDEGLSLAHLIGTLKHVAGQLLGSTRVPDHSRLLSVHRTLDPAAGPVDRPVRGAPRGWSFWVPAWSIPTCSRSQATTASAGRASRSVWAWTASRWCATACPICACCSTATCACSSSSPDPILPGPGRR